VTQLITLWKEVNWNARAKSVNSILLSLQATKDHLAQIQNSILNLIFHSKKFKKIQKSKTYHDSVERRPEELQAQYFPPKGES
jgi:hypothetical protein